MSLNHRNRAASDPIRLTILHPADPAGPKVGGAETFLREFIRCAPDLLDLRIIGVSCDAHNRPVNQWVQLDISGRNIALLPVLIESDEDRKRKIPVALRFAYHTSRYGIPADTEVALHNRIESLSIRGLAPIGNVTIIHNDIPQQISGAYSEVLWSRFPPAYYWFERRSFRKCDRIFTVSMNTLNDYTTRYPDLYDRIAFVPTCVDSDVFRPCDDIAKDARQELSALTGGADPDVPWILFVARLQKQKAPVRMIETLAKLREKNPSVILLVAGDGNLLEETRRAAAAFEVDDSVHFLGSREKSELVRLYSLADVLLVTSNYEGMPMCVLESLACGTPVVSTAVGEVGRVIENGVTGEIVESLDSADLADAVAKVLQFPERYSATACRNAVIPYAPATVMAPIYDTLISIANENRNKRSK